jgi:hypothetical protein
VEYFEEYIKLNKREGNRHLTCCLTKFKEFIKSDFITPVDITENFCKRFRRYLLDKLTGESPANYYARFKWVVKAATRDSYFRTGQLFLTAIYYSRINHIPSYVELC